MKAVVRISLATLALVALWAVVVFVGTSEGWWKRTLAPRGDTAGFMNAAARLVDTSNAGNAVFAVIEAGSVHGVHAVSIGEAVDVNTVFQTASLSKWVTAWGVMALVQEGKLDLDAPVGTYLTRWALPEGKFDNNKVTARRLLSHTAGLTDGLGYAGFEPGAAVQSLEESLARPADASPGASGAIEVGYEPGSEWQYSGGGYAILQLLIEEVSGESFEGFMQRVILRPLGMIHSSYSWTPADGSILATFYDTDSKPTTHYRFAAVAASSLYTSVSDMTLFVQAHLPGKNGEPIGRGVLAPETIKEMWRPQASKFGDDIWGLGTILYADNNEGGFVVGHDGNNEPAINTSARLNPATGNGIVILETGKPLLATQLAGEWVFWETSNLDFLAFMIAMPGMLRLIGVGSLVIVLSAPTIAWSIRRRRSGRPAIASAVREAEPGSFVIGGASVGRSIALIVLSIITAVASAAPVPDVGWSAYGGDAGGTRYSTAAQITSANVDQLEVAWTFRTGELGQGVKDWSRSAFEATPILYDGTLYLTTPSTDVVAVNAITGQLRWRHDSRSRNDLHYSDGVSRGVSLWVDESSPRSAVCRARIFAPTLDGRLLALDAGTGKLCVEFGERGAVNLLQDVRSQFKEGDEWRDYLVTSPPAILDDKVIVGSSIGDNRAVLEELGIVRAYDARNGRLVWSWDPIPREASNPVYKEWNPASVATASAANAWAPLSVDAARRLVFVPTGSASPDFFGGLRPGDNRWANSIVALDADTGQLRWGQQLVHHDLWDYDLASQPTLANLVRGGKPVAAVIQATKMGFLFTFDRDSGTPVFPIVERPVPQDAVPGERPSPTQPYPVAPPALARQGPVTAEDAWGLTWFDTRACRKRIEGYRSKGMFQPPTLQDSLMQPGNAGGSNWGGIAFDPRRQLAIANTVNLPFVVALVPREKLQMAMDSGAYDDFDFSRQHGTPYGMRRTAFTSDLGIPCVKPPWGQLTAVDMTRGTIKWQIPLGVTPFIPLNLGLPGLGGPIVTAGGLVFIAASFDDRLRAFDTDNGRLKWQVKLPAGGQATPMTYVLGGRQYVVIAAGGYKEDSTRGDFLVAYALP